MIIVFLLIAIFLAVYALFPFFETEYKNRKLPRGSTDRENFMYRKEEILTALNDLEYDFKMKKMAEDDYAQLKEKFTREAIEVIKKLDQSERKTDIHAGRAGARESKRQKVRS